MRYKSGTILGVPLIVGSNAAARLTTPALELKIVDIVSSRANNLTDNNWDAFVGTRSDALPEVPDDGNSGRSPVYAHNLFVQPLSNSLQVRLLTWLFCRTLFS